MFEAVVRRQLMSNDRDAELWVTTLMGWHRSKKPGFKRAEMAYVRFISAGWAKSFMEVISSHLIVGKRIKNVDDDIPIVEVTAFGRCVAVLKVVGGGGQQRYEGLQYADESMLTPENYEKMVLNESKEGLACGRKAWHSKMLSRYTWHSLYSFLKWGNTPEVKEGRDIRDKKEHEALKKRVGEAADRYPAFQVQTLLWYEGCLRAWTRECDEKAREQGGDAAKRGLDTVVTAYQPQSFQIDAVNAMTEYNEEVHPAVLKLS